ncbi:broad-complex core protein isoforms 1/2/3/4/5 isoform X3 [Neodiprion lecontei]|uniref:Broad-complex core protein isoforms 1/2/3/4/5 isoform X3 n=1 Tax=Neodiprion lecontei TaxID=441921 RepID=A0ABM3FLT2_NEOLC|nr:broad-complex core protein isoforms 1/2/3/4/5 isoform X3 [Neodiprion lecontei]
MVDTQHFCLRWNNYQSSITSAFENLRDDEDFVDVTLACDGKSLKAHRVVLSACSPYFRELLKSTPCKHPVIVLQDVAFSDLHALVEFIYHGEVNVHQRSLSSFLKTAEVLRVSGLTQQADQTDRDELSHVRALAAGNHLPTHEKLPEENFLRGNSSPPSAATMPVPTSLHQQIFHKSQIRKNEIHPYNTHNDKIKRARLPSPPLNNNDAIPTDFSMIKSNHLSSKIEGNGLNEDSSHVEENIKCEPLELTGGNGGGNGGNHDDSSNSEAAASDRPPASASSNEHDPEPEHPPPSFLPSESKLFTTTPGTYNFTMSALTTDHSPLSVKFPGLGHGLQTTDLAGTSQEAGLAMTSSQNQLDIHQSIFGDSSTDHLGRVSQVKPKLEIFPVINRRRIDPDSANCCGAVFGASGGSGSGSGSAGYAGASSSRSGPANDSEGFPDTASLGFPPPPAPSFDALIPFDVNLLPESAPSDWFANIPPEFRNANTESMQGLPCTHCGKWLRNKITLKRHIQDLHCAQSEEFRCTICNKVYRTKNSLVVHTCNYHGGKRLAAASFNSTSVRQLQQAQIAGLDFL